MGDEEAPGWVRRSLVDVTGLAAAMEVPATVHPGDLSPPCGQAESAVMRVEGSWNVRLSTLRSQLSTVKKCRASFPDG